MDKVAYDQGYKDAIEAIKQALKNAGQDGQSSGSGDGLPINPKNNDGPLSKDAQDKMDKQQGGQSGQSGMSVPQPGQGGGQGSGSDEKRGPVGGSSRSSAARKGQEGEVTKMGGSFIDKKVGEQIAKEAGYDADEVGVDENVESKWQKIGKQVSQGIGSGKGGRLKGLIDEIYKPSKNWKQELRTFIGHAVGGIETHTSWGRKAFLQNDEIRRFDSPNNDCLDKVVFMIDTSGSNIGCLQLIVNECYCIVEKKKIPEVTYVYYDDGIEGIDVVKNVRNAKPSMLKNTGGGGGTSFARAIADFDKYLKNKRHIHKVDLLMVFTDLDTCDYVKTKPTWAKNVMFVVTDRPGAEPMDWGKTIYINSSDVK